MLAGIRKAYVPDIFSLCNSKSEDMLHVLRDCCKAKCIWLAMRVLDVDSLFFQYNWADWLEVNLKNKAKVEGPQYGSSIDWKVLFAITCWMIWKWRCMFCIENQSCWLYNPKEVISRYALEMINTNQRQRFASLKQTCWLRWECPKEGFVVEAPNFIKHLVLLNCMGKISSRDILVQFVLNFALL